MTVRAISSVMPAAITVIIVGTARMVIGRIGSGLSAEVGVMPFPLPPTPQIPRPA